MQTDLCSSSYGPCAFWGTYETICDRIQCRFNAAESGNIEGTPYWRINPNCPDAGGTGTGCCTIIISRNSGCRTCPPGQKSPHYICQSGICVIVESCGEDSGGCITSGQQCNCPSGFDRPYRVCDPDGKCKEVNDGTCNFSECSSIGVVCDPPCDPPRKKGFLACNEEGRCVTQYDTNGNLLCGADFCQREGCECLPPGPCITARVESGCALKADRWCDCPLGYFKLDGGCCTTTPIIIDLNDDGLNLTSVFNGVNFDFNNDDVKERMAWTSSFSDDAFLVLDRNGNGLIDGGRELLAILHRSLNLWTLMVFCHSLNLIN